MDFRGVRAPVGLISLLVLGGWAGSALGAGAVNAVTTTVAGAVSTDPTATAPVTTTTAAEGGVVLTTPSVTVTRPTFTITFPSVTVTLPTSPRPQPVGGGVSTPTVTATTPTVTATTPTVTAPKPPVSKPPPVVTAPPPLVGGQVTTPTVTTLGSAAPGSPGAAGALATSNGPTADPVVAAAGTANAAAATAAASDSAASASARGAQAPAKAAPTRPKRRARTTRAAKPRSTAHARPAAKAATIDQPRSGHAAVRPSPTTIAKKVTASATAAISRVKPLLLPKTSATPATPPAGGGRAGAVPSEPDPGVGFGTPSGRFSISPAGFQLGGSQHPIASASGVVAAALITLAVLAAFAAASGGVAVLRTIMRSRRASGSRATVTSAKGRTRQQLYSEAKRQNIRGRSSMNKAQLERALSHQGASR